MAFSCGKNWRYNYVNIDQSVVINDTDSTVIGWIAARAPKGTRRATYFAKNNGELIDAMMGTGDANWPDIIEAKAFNAEYPIYISAPPGSSTAYPSYTDGRYLTKKGLLNFYKVESVDDLRENSGNAFITNVVPMLENKFDTELDLSKVEVGYPGATAAVSSDGLVTIVDTSASDAEYPNQYYIKFEKDSSLDVQFIDYDAMKSGLVASSGTDTTYWSDDEGLWEFDGSIAKLSNFGIEYTAAQTAADDFNPLKDWLGVDPSVVKGSDLITLLTAGAVTVSGTTYSIAFPITGLFTYGVDISDISYCAIAQTSPTEIETTVKITDVGYDEYQYDEMLPYFKESVLETDSEGTVLYTADTTGTSVTDDDVQAFFKKHEYIIMTDGTKPTRIGLRTKASDGTTYCYEETDELNTQTVVPHESVTGVKNKNVYHKFYRVDDSDELTNLVTEEEMIDLYGTTAGEEAYESAVSDDTAASKDTDYNTFTFSCTEPVRGKTYSGGEFTGSLDEDGTDIYGNLNYWPLIIGEDDATFVKVVPNKKFGGITGDTDDNGFYKGSRIIDPCDVDGDGSSPTSRTVVLAGDRYCTLVMEMNRNAGEKGGVWRTQYTNIIKEALEEATASYYDDAYIFMEPTGQEQFKSYIKNINTAQEMAMTISPKLLSYNSKHMVTEEIAKKVVVNGRVGTGSCGAQYAGAFYAKDDVTNASYIRYPIGAVGLALARSAENYYGGKAIMQYSGGLLDGTVTSALYSIEDAADKTLTEKGINPIILKNGQMMVTSDRTTKNPVEISDWSYVAHAHSFLIIKREIRDNVMSKQLGLPISKYWVSKRTADVERLLSKRTLGDNAIWNTASCDCSKSLNSVNKAKRNFVIEVEIQVLPNTETVTLVITNRSQ